MAKKLNRSSHREREYNRPAALWLCGHSKDGKVCPHGPSAKGGCQGSAECMPVRKGDRWQCTRSVVMGGACESGPLPNGKCACALAACQPLRSFRSKRKLATLAVALFTVGFLLVVLSRAPEDSAIDAGRLTTSHAGRDMSCKDCHTETSLGDLKKVFDPHFLTDRSLANSELCLDCHSKQIGQWQKSARYAHGWTVEKILAKVEQAGKKLEEKQKKKQTEKRIALALLLAAKEPVKTNGIEGRLACMTCHQEHHGSEHKLTTLTDHQCQVCHQQQFKDFKHGHPSFAETDYPYSRRTRIFFDHDSHYKKHFTEKTGVSIKGYDAKHPFKGSESCLQCHEADEKGAFVRLRGFDVSCAVCHTESVKGGDALTMLAIPEISPSLVEGNWPKSGYGLVPAMRLLLNEKSNEQIVELGKSDEYGSLSLTGIGKPDVVKQVASDLQALFAQSWSEGSEVLASRVEQGGYRAGKVDAALYKGLSIDTVRRLLFPGSQWALGDFSFPAIDMKSLNRFLSKKQRSAGLWPQPSAGSLSPLMQHLLSYRPGLRESLQLLKARVAEDGAMSLEDLSQASDAEMRAVQRIVWEVKLVFSDLKKEGLPYLEQFQNLSGGILNVNPEQAVLDQVFVSAFGDTKFIGGIDLEVADYKAGNYPEAVAVSVKKPVQKAGADMGDDDFGDSKAAATDDDFGDAPAEPKKVVTGDDDFGDAPVAADDDFGGDVKVKQEAVVKVNKGVIFYEPDPVDWQSEGGWYYEKHAIHYRSKGHADPVIRSWVEAAVASSNLAGGAAKKNGQAVLDFTLQWKAGVETNASGKCFKCHTIDRDPESGLLQVNWSGAYGDSGSINRVSRLTRFSHDKHLVALECSSCHQLAGNKLYAKAFIGHGAGGLSDPAKFDANFLPLNRKKDCASCHRKARAGNHCLKCHSYHDNARLHLMPIKK